MDQSNRDSGRTNPSLGVTRGCSTGDELADCRCLLVGGLLLQVVVGEYVGVSSLTVIFFLRGIDSGSMSYIQSM